ncbi:UNVERIFIED_CONTAM: hypothetical protein Slati_0478100 [Sesamum latifolium]|uniref:Gag-pol polyprotein n=1 Tax=Sesamum latifolium TaxID=2727402 RepID=A0AAW2XWL1_9LAMI
MSASPCTVRRRSLVSYYATLSFTDEDLLLGSKPHNRPLFILGFIQEQRVNRILIDGGSAVNIMPKTTMKKLGITLEDLSRSRLTIQGFDQGTQRAVGMTRLDLTVGELKASTLFHVIDARTSYNLLLGRPWLHENGVVPSTLHKCFKYIKNGEIVKVDADMKSFTEAESYFADAKLYLDNMQEVLPSRFSVGYSSEKVHPKATPIENNNEKLSETATDEDPTNGKHEVKKPPYSLVFLYIVRSNNKEKKNQPKEHVPLLFKERKQLKEVKVKDLQEIKAELVMPIIDLHPLISSDSPIPDDQHRNMHGAFSLKAYHLLVKSGYDFPTPSRLNKLKPELTGEKNHGLTKAQQKLRKQDNGKSGENQKPNDNRISVFKRLGTPIARASVFERLSKARGPIKVKQHVAGKPHDSSEILNEEEIEIIVGSKHISIDESSDSDISEDEIQNAPPELEDGVQATVDELT